MVMLLGYLGNRRIMEGRGRTPLNPRMQRRQGGLEEGNLHGEWGWGGRRAGGKLAGERGLQPSSPPSAFQPKTQGEGKRPLPSP